MKNTRKSRKVTPIAPVFDLALAHAKLQGLIEERRGKLYLTKLGMAYA